MAEKREVFDMASAPDFNPTTNTGRGDWSLRDVSAGDVWLDPVTKAPRCRDHNAMNCVNQLRTLWRCLACGRACHMPHP